jgi:hypothetical protein
VCGLLEKPREQQPVAGSAYWRWERIGKGGDTGSSVSSGKFG